MTAEHRPNRTSGRCLLVAATGGHLDELHRLRHRLIPAVRDADWVTFDDPQSRSLLAGERVHVARYVPPRGYRPAAANFLLALRVLRRGGYQRVVSTGSGIAVPFFLAARMRGLACHYIESAARAEGPSLTGRVVSRVPGVRVYTQYPEWADERWVCAGSLFDAYEPHPGALPAAPISGASAHRVVVTLGTMRTYGFRRALKNLVPVLNEVVALDAEILWQVGATDSRGFGIAARDRIPVEELQAAVADADLVVAHAGIGSALTALDHGKCPLLLPRRKAHGEHVDDHQEMIARRLAARGLAVAAEADEVDARHCWTAMSTRVRTRQQVAQFALE